MAGEHVIVMPGRRVGADMTRIVSLNRLVDVSLGDAAGTRVYGCGCRAAAHRTLRGRRRHGPEGCRAVDREPRRMRNRGRVDEIEKVHIAAAARRLSFCDGGDGFGVADVQVRGNEGPHRMRAAAIASMWRTFRPRPAVRCAHPAAATTIRPKSNSTFPRLSTTTSGIPAASSSTCRLRSPQSARVPRMFPFCAGRSPRGERLSSGRASTSPSASALLPYWLKTPSGPVSCTPVRNQF